MTVIELAAQYLTYFRVLERENAPNTYCWKEDVVVPEALKDLCYEAHEDMMPDDYKYNYIVDALELIADSDEDTDLEELSSSNIEADVYTFDLLKWLSSNLDRHYYVNGYVQDLLGTIEAKDFDLIQLISGGQWLEKREVFNIILNGLNKIVEELPEIEDENEDEV